MPIFSIRNLEAIPGNTQLQWRVIDKPARGAGDASLLKQKPLLTADVDSNGEAQLQTGALESGVALMVLLAGRRGKRAAERILYKKAYDSVSDIRDREPINIESRDDGPLPEPIAKPTKPTRPINEGGPNSDERGRPRPKQNPPKSLAQQLRDRQIRDIQLGEELKAVVGPAVERRNRKKRECWDFAGKVLGRRPLGRRHDRDFVPAGGAKEQAVERQITKSMESLKASHSKRKGISIRGPKDLNWAPGKFKTSAELINAIPGAVGAGTITNNFSPLQACLDERMVDSIFADETEGSALENKDKKNQTSPGNKSELAKSNRPLEDIIQSIISSDPFQSALEKRPDRKVLEKNLQMSLSSGPADETAYYDFDKLHIAWKDSWTAALSDKTASEVAQLYAEIIQLVDYDPPEKSENAEANELKELMGELSGVVASVSAELTMPSELGVWLDPLLSPDQSLTDVWSAMTTSDQELLRYYHDVQKFCDENKYLFTDIETEEFAKLDERKEFLEDQDNIKVRSWRRDNPKDPDGKVWMLEFYTRKLNNKLLYEYAEFDDYDVAVNFNNTIAQIAGAGLATQKAASLVSLYREKIDSGNISSPLGRAEQLITELQAQSDKPYQFDIFVPDSVNFGLLTTYRQQWKPLAYQAGDLVGTIPLAPNEKRTYSIKESFSQTRKSNRSNTSLTSRNEEFSSLARSEAEIQRKTDQMIKAGANLDSNSNLDASAGFLGNGLSSGTSLNVGGSFNSDMGSESATTKKDISETTRKMAQEFRDEHKVEISEETTSSYESSQTREISNPNNEISVTYLFYELQRRFEVATRLQQVTPVIMVAFHVPNPDEINETWLLKYEWILRPALLDRKFGPVFRALSESFAGDEIAVEILEAQWKTQLAIVAELRRQMGAHTDLRDAARDAVVAASQEVSMASSGNGGSGNLGAQVVDALEYTALGLTTGVGGVLAKALFDKKDKDEDETADPVLSGEALGSERDSARQALDWADLDRAQSEGGLRESIGALERATEKYLNAVQSRLNRRTQIDQLILHIKTNITHYMQAIWRAENRDQRYFRLYDVKVPWPNDSLRMISGNGSKLPEWTEKAPAIDKDNGISFSLAESEPSKIVEFSEISLTSKRQLHEIADLDTILGFRGNYAVFRVTEPNNISTYLLQDFLDSYFGLIDPDDKGNVLTVHEALEVARCAWSHSQVTDENKKEISEWLLKALEAANAASQMITVPTGELFIEALPGTHPILEDFKLKHRAADAQKAGADAKMAEIEVLRRAKRVLDGETGDPDVDRVIRIEGSTAAIHVDSE